MEIFAEVDVRSSQGTAYIVEALRRFSGEEADWVFEKGISGENSSQVITEPSCVLSYVAQDQNVGVYFHEKREGRITTLNIVPRKSSSISVESYNRIAYELYESLKRWSKREKAGLSLKMSKTDLELEDIISAKVPLRLFQTYLKNHPLSFHPLDLGRLDRFTCSVARYSRKPINWDHLSQYLVEKENWRDEDVEWLLNRIQMGLDVIREYRRFR